MSEHKDESSEDSARVARDFVETLNKHGYGFQHAILTRAKSLVDERRTHWRFEATEFPVTVRDQVTHIDIVLKAATSDIYLVGECKRVDPAMSRWCFARAPYIRRRSGIVLQDLVSHPTFKVQSSYFLWEWTPAPYHIGVEPRTRLQGDGTATGRDNIERAVTQVLRGMNGLINRFQALDWTDLPNRALRFVPVVFTTAELWTTEVDIGQAELESGRIANEDFDVKSPGWLWLNYNLSPHLRHDVMGSSPPQDLSEVLVAESTRSVAIVSPKGLDAFLQVDFSDL